MLDFLQEYAKYMHLYEYWMHICLYVCMFLLRLLPPQPPYKGFHKGGPKAEGRRPTLVEAAEGRLLYMVAGEAASAAKTYRRISKYALNMHIDAYISNIPSKSLSS